VRFLATGGVNPSEGSDSRIFIGIMLPGNDGLFG
jgi:hypothetical protein